MCCWLQAKLIVFVYRQLNNVVMFIFYSVTKSCFVFNKYWCILFINMYRVKPGNTSIAGNMGTPGNSKIIPGAYMTCVV